MELGNVVDYIITMLNFHPFIREENQICNYVYMNSDMVEVKEKFQTMCI
jgi:hypothetical protein